MKTNANRRTIMTDDDNKTESATERELRVLERVKHELEAVEGGAFRVPNSMGPRVAALAAVAARSALWERRINERLDSLIEAVADYDRMHSQLSAAVQEAIAERELADRPAGPSGMN